MGAKPEMQPDGGFRVLGGAEKTPELFVPVALPETPLAEVLDRWLKAERPAPGTEKKYRGGLRRLAEHGIVTIADACDRQKLSRFYESRRENAATSTANTDITSVTVLTEYLEQTDGTLPDGMTASLRRVRRKPKRVQKARLSFLELEHVERIAVEAEKIHPMLALAIWVAWWAGLRHFELRRLKREHVELGAKPVARVMWMVEELGDEGRIKTWREREVPIEAPLKALLEKHFENAPDVGYLFGAIRRYSHGKERKLVSPDWLRRNITKAARRAGVTHTGRVTLKTFRISCAVRWINADIPEAKVCDAMGHTPEVFRRFYKQIKGGYDAKFETTTTKVVKHWSEQATPAQRAAPQGRTTTNALTKSDVARLQAAERALLRAKERGQR